jgi:putative acetyltransferase
MLIKVDDLRGSEVAQLLNEHLQDMYAVSPPESVSLETGTVDFFIPTRKLYERFGFEYCGPFGDYQEDPYSAYMTKSLI